MIDFCHIIPDKLFKGATLLCILVTAWLAFEKSFVEELERQMVYKENPGGVGTSSVKFPYNMIARLRFGHPKNWIDLFDPTKKEKMVKDDKTLGIRIFFW